MPRRFRAPAGNGAVLADPAFDAVPALVEANRRLLDRDDIVVGGLPLRELRALARREVLELARDYTSNLSHSSPPAAGGLGANAPLLIAGHQPELSHPGVWVKNFALNGLARKVGGIPLNLIVDNDTLKSTAVRVPAVVGRGPQAVLESVAFDQPRPFTTTYEVRRVADPDFFRSFPERAAAYWGNWNFSPLLPRVWRRVLEAWPGLRAGTFRYDHRPPNGPLPGEGNIGHMFSAARRASEADWGATNLELPVSLLSSTYAYAHFAWEILTNLPRFREVYNAAVQRYRRANRIENVSHPVPDLGERDGWTEAPFWGELMGGKKGRGRPWVRNRGDELDWRVEGDEFGPGWLPGILAHFLSHVPTKRSIRPRALTLTLFARVCLGDFFIHGIGGGKYDEVTDDIIRHYFGLEPPAYQVLSATLHLPLPGFPATAADARRADRYVRDLHWNPQRHLSPEAAARPDVAALVREKERLAAAEPPYREHAARRAWFRDLAAVTEKLRPFVWKQVPPAKSAVIRTRAEAQANAVLRRRDYSWVLYPEDTLRPFLQRFLAV